MTPCVAPCITTDDFTGAFVNLLRRMYRLRLTTRVHQCRRGTVLRADLLSGEAVGATADLTHGQTHPGFSASENQTAPYILLLDIPYPSEI